MYIYIFWKKSVQYIRYSFKKLKREYIIFSQKLYFSVLQIFQFVRKIGKEWYLLGKYGREMVFVRKIGKRNGICLVNRKGNGIC